MNFGIYIPSKAESAKVPVIYWLSGKSIFSVYCWFSSDCLLWGLMQQHLTTLCTTLLCAATTFSVEVNYHFVTIVVNWFADFLH